MRVKEEKALMRRIRRYSDSVNHEGIGFFPSNSMSTYILQFLDCPQDYQNNDNDNNNNNNSSNNLFSSVLVVY